MTTMGKFRHLSRCSTPEGHFAILAIDHRTNLRDRLNRYGPTPLTDEAFIAFKREVITALLPAVSAVLVDPAFGLGSGIADRTLGGPLGLLAPLESTNYNLHPSRRSVHFIRGWSVAKLKRMGGDGVKMLLPYHPEDNDAADKREIVQQIVAQCVAEDIPLFLEPIAYSLDPEGVLDSDERQQVVVEIARTFSELGVDVLKLQFPVDSHQTPDEARWADACREVDAACKVPWALLSAGVGYDLFLRQARIACAAGASGVIVGRAVWAEAVELHGDARRRFLTETARKRMAELARVCRREARPWFERVPAPQASVDWYESYGESS